MMIANSTSIYNFLPIRGGERVSFSVSTYSGEFERDKEYSMYVYKVSGINPKDTKENFMLHFSVKRRNYK